MRQWEWNRILWTRQLRHLRQEAFLRKGPSSEGRTQLMTGPDGAGSNVFQAGSVCLRACGFVDGHVGGLRMIRT